MHRNPPVTVQELPDPDDAFAHLDHGLDYLDDEEPVGGPDHGPPFVEWEDAPLGGHPEDEPLMHDAMLRAFLDMSLGDYAETEWFDLCEFHPPIME